MFNKLYNSSLSWAQSKHALWILAAVSFAESSVFPIPPDVLMVPMILAAPHRAWLIAAVTLVSSVLGGVAGYLIGMFAFEQIGQPVLEALGKADSMAAFNDRFNDFGFWAVLGAGITPFPYKVITIMSGWTAMPLGVFIATSILARGIRFFLVAALLRVYGEPIRTFIERRLAWVVTAAFIVLVAGFLLVGRL